MAPQEISISQLINSFIAYMFGLYNNQYFEKVVVGIMIEDHVWRDIYFVSSTVL